MATLAAAPGHQAGRPHPGWAGLTWVTWRQQRTMLAGVAGLLGACALALGITGLRMHSARATLAHSGCPLQGAVYTSRCGRLQDAYYHAGYPLAGNVPLVTIGLWVLPVLIGMFAGAPLIARELESGTCRFAWTQAAGRARWLASRLVPLAGMLTAAAAAFGALCGWWLGQADTSPLIQGSPWQAGQFGLTAVTFAAWILLAFAAGVFGGALIGRAVPAMAATAVTTAGLIVLTFWKLTGLLTGAVPVTVRGSLASPAQVTLPNSVGYLPGGEVVKTPAGSWPVNVWLTTAHGQLVSTFSSRLTPLWMVRPVAEPGWLARHRLTLWVSYQPADRFWLFQGAEAAALVLLAVLLATATVWLVHRRPG